MSSNRIVPGVYDIVVNEALATQLEALPNDQRKFEDPFHPKHDRELAALSFARAVYDRTLATLRGLTDQDDATGVERQSTLTNQMLAVLQAASSATLTSDRVHAPARRLLAVVDAPEGRLVEPLPPQRPEVPLASSDLLVNGRHDLRLGTEVVRELASADSVDLLCSFLKWSGYRVIEESLRAFLERKPGGLRVLTTAYMGATERRALDALVALGAEVRVSYDTERTRLHAKAWLFHRHSGFSTACIGSSNLSHAAMLDGLEWNVRLSQIDNGTILEKFGRVFAQYWSDGTFEAYDPARDADRWDTAVRRQVADRSRLLLAIHVEPKPHQLEALEQLDAERARGHHRNLVVAATGTGKTFIAAFDYKALCKQAGRRLSLLFVAHRHEILEQSQTVFRVVLGDAIFGERLGNSEKPRRDEHVFANIQSLRDDVLLKLAPDAFDVVIVDEFHHAASKTYDALLRQLKPKHLIGLTATPERSDGRSVLGHFDDRIAVELRLWKALDQGLLCPFQYFGVSDGTDLARLWTRNHYDPSGLSNVYTANDFWIRRVLQEVHRRIADPQRMRALGFCVDIDHANFVAENFNRAGLASVALTQKNSLSERADALARLQSGELRAVFSVDILSEGVDVPDVDTVLFLRPTESATLFLQQLGRGLRRRPDKDCLTVLDFIGKAHRKFRFDMRFRAIVGGTREQIVKEIERGFPHLPSGCSIQLDAIASKVVIENIQGALGRGDEVLVDDLRALGDVDLATFLKKAQLELEDIYSKSGKTFTQLRRRAALPTAPSADAPAEERIARSVARLLHIDDPHRLEAFASLVAHSIAPDGNSNDPLARMLFACLGWMNRPLAELGDAWSELWSSPALLSELRELFAVLSDRTHSSRALGGRLAGIPLRVHATYGLDEVMAALDERDAAGRIKRLREGVFHSKKHRAELLFVTLDKSEDDYSPSTMYRDFALSRHEFHWESTNAVHADTETGRRYITQASQDHAVLLFVRQRRKARADITSPYVFLGPCRYVSHTGARPMAITWRLAYDIPSAFFQELKVAAG